MGKKKNSSWARICVPSSGAPSESLALQTAAVLAEQFGAQLSCVFAPPDPAELAPWLGDGLSGAMQMQALDSINTAANQSRIMAQAALEAIIYADKRFLSLQSPVWMKLGLETRLSDLVVFGGEAAKGQGLLAEAFQQVLMQERAAVFIARKECDFKGTALVAWDAKEPSSRAARRSVPLLKKASRVIIIGAPAGDDPADLKELQAYYACHGIEAELETLPKPADYFNPHHDLVKALSQANERFKADYMVVGAFGHARFQEFVFGGTTRALLQNTTMNLFMAH